MANIGAQAATAVDEKIREFRTLQTELNTHQSDLGTLMAQRNENEMVKQVSLVKLFVLSLCITVVCIFICTLLFYLCIDCNVMLLMYPPTQTSFTIILQYNHTIQ